MLETAVTFEMSEEDVLRLLRYNADSSPTNRKIRLFTAVVASSTAALCSHMLGGARIAVVAWAAAGFILTMVLYRWGGPSFNRIVWRQHIRERKGAPLGPVTIAIDAEGVRTRSARGDGFTRWVAIDRIAEDDDYIYLMVPMAGLAVPKRAFGDSSRAFVEQARMYHRGAAEQRDATDEMAGR